MFPPWLVRSVFLIIVASSVIVRLPAVTEMFLGPDELMVWSIAQGESAEEILRRALFEVHPPLESFFRAGIRPLVDSIQGLRVLYMGIATVGILLCSYALFASPSPAAFLILLFILSFSRVFVVSSVLLRSYPLLIFFFGAAMFFFSQVTGENRRPIVAIVGMWFSMALAGCSHFSAFLACPGFFVPTIFVVWKRGDRRSVTMLVSASVALCVQGALLYLYFFSPDTGASAWRRLSKSDIFSRCAGFTDPGRLMLHVLGMFNVSPLEVLPYSLLVVTGCVGAAIYAVALLFCFRKKRLWFFFATITWGIALLSNQLGLYPVTGGKQSIFLLLCIAVPMALFFAEVVSQKIAISSLSVAALCISLASLSANFSYFREASDMPLTQKQYEDIRDSIRVISRAKEPVYTSRFGLLYGLFARDGLSKFYMDETSRTSIVTPDGELAFCAPGGLWQSTKSELSYCLSPNPSVPSLAFDETIWFLSVGFEDTLFESLRECAVRYGELVATRSSKGVQLFALHRNFVERALALEGCLAGYREDHCAKAL